MYRNAETLYRETLRRNPESWMAHNNLGVILAGRPGRLRIRSVIAAEAG
jgi:Flp pilus assembly protein TadD